MRNVFYRLWPQRFIWSTITKQFEQIDAIVIMREIIPEDFKRFISIRFEELNPEYDALHLSADHLPELIECAETFDIVLKPWS